MNMEVVVSSPLVGAWEGGPEGYRGMLVFTEIHYAAIFERTDRLRGFKGERPTQAEEAEAYRTLGGGGGTYTISGNVLTRNEELDRLPTGHKPVSTEFAIEGDTLTLRNPRTGRTSVYKKVS